MNGFVLTEDSGAKKNGIRSRFISIFETVGVEQDDSDELILQKAILVAISVSIAFFGIIWGIVYIYLGAVVSAMIPLTYSALSFVNVFIFHRTKKIDFYRSSQLILIIFLPFFLMISLGGFANSSVVIIWSLLAPLGALLFADFRKAPYWFGLYVILLFIAGIIEYYLPTDSLISKTPTLLFYILNLGAVSTILFFTEYYFVAQKTKAFDLLNQLAENQFSDLIDKLNFEGDQTFIDQSESTPVLFMIIDNRGIAIYSKVYSDQKFDDQLISGFLTAINAFSKEAFGTKFLREITYQDFHLMFNIIKDCRIVYAFKGNHTSAELKFNNILNRLSTKEFEFVFMENTTSLNDNTALSNLINSTF